MIVNFQINGITVQTSGPDNAMINSGILSHVIEIQKIASAWKTIIENIESKSSPKKDIEDLDFDNNKNPEDEERKDFDPDYDSIG